MSATKSKDAPSIRGMAWDHPRALDPLAAISEEWSRACGGSVEWDARPLKAFEDQPLEELAEAYDLVLMDYPFTGTAAGSGMIRAVDEWASEPYIREQATHSVGPSHLSYHWHGRQWALAIDAACQVSAWREDLLPEASEGPPDSWQQVAELAADCRSGPSVAMPLNPNHAYCAFLSVGLSLAGTRFWRFGEPSDRSTGIEALKFLKRLAGDLHPASRDDDPIAVSDRMARSDEVLYVPLMFGYSNYARPGFRRNRLKFGDAPIGVSSRRGSVLGGVGIALSARSRHPEASAGLARMLCDPSVQAGRYVKSGGQPGHGLAWESEAANRLVSDFFRDTRNTIEQAFVRPRVPGHRRFQPEAGAVIHEYLWSEGLSADECHDRYEALFERYLSDWAALEQAPPDVPRPETTT